MRLVSGNLAPPHLLDLNGRSEVTAIAKQPAQGPVAVHRLGLDGDGVGDTDHHGGPDQAVYAYALEDYAWWSAELGRELPPGTFGENLTIAGLEGAERRIGDRLRIGSEVVVELTAPRIPCATLAGRMADPRFVKRFARARRPGLYLRVMQTGSVVAGDAVELDASQSSALLVTELMRLHYDRKAPAAELEQALAAPLATRYRAALEQRLEQARSQV